jgi:hypothetical protein
VICGRLHANQPWRVTTIDKNGYVYLSLGGQVGKSPWLVGGSFTFGEFDHDALYYRSNYNADLGFWAESGNECHYEVVPWSDSLLPELLTGPSFSVSGGAGLGYVWYPGRPQSEWSPGLMTPQVGAQWTNTWQVWP